jgi:MFS family permease
MVREHLPAPEVSPSRQFLFSFKQGFVYIWQNVGLRSLIFYATALNFVGAPLMNVVFPYFGKEVLLLEAQHYGTVQAMFPVGFLVGTVLVGYLTKKFRKEALLTSGITLQGLIVVMVGTFALPAVYSNAGLVNTLLSLSSSLLVIGVLNTLVNVPFQVMLQETVPDSYRGRVYGLIDSVGQMLVPLSMAISGFLVDSFSPASLFILSGLITAGLGFSMASSAKIKLLYAQEDSLATDS